MLGAAARRPLSRANTGRQGENAGVRRSVCLYTRSANPSGMGAHMLDLVEGLAGRADVSVLCRDSPRARWLLEGASARGARTVALPSPHDAAYPAIISGFLSSHPVDVFHCHAGWGWEDPDGLRLARAAGVPAVVITHHQPFLLHKPAKAEKLVENTSFAHARIAVSDGVRDTYIAHGVSEERFSTVPNGVRPRKDPPGRTAARAALHLQEGDLVVLSTGRLTTMKGQRYLIEAAALLKAGHPRLQVVILGEGDLREELEALVAARGLAGTVHLPGHRQDARMLLDAADVFALPSRSEGMPLALLEAMEAGLPVVATRVIGSAEVVAHGRTGLLVPTENAGGLAAALAELLEDGERRALYGEAGRRRYLDEYTVDCMVARTQAVYDATLQPSPEPARSRSRSSPQR
ncbi:glycosyltransferase family 4 protein [Kocuria sp.]|jgi:glycosyltransferase involved in cell wall biosynthesis|uniref:glycosyltransferase family 4 protein n=1 Tax=Kocuria sp. TaxID=1871328 RepID=UPI0028110CA4|nr:glycosyltransferase family 4 protein [Kocuria sp.]